LQFMSETEDQISSPVVAPSPDVRFGVFEMIGEEKKTLAKIAISKQEDGTWAAQLSGDTEAILAKIQSVLDRYGDNSRALAVADGADPASVPRDWNVFADMMRQEGFVVEELPAGDIQLNVQLDMVSGRLIGTQQAMHALAASDDPLGRRLVEAIAGGFSRPADDLAHEIEQSITDQSPEGAVSTIRRDMNRGIFSFPPSDKLLSALARIDVSAMPNADKRLVRECRLHTAQRLNRFDVAGQEAGALLAEEAERLDPAQKATLEMAIALAAIKRGNRETGLSMLRKLLAAPFKTLSALLPCGGAGKAVAQRAAASFAFRAANSARNSAPLLL
jgi:hypothetical protein